MKIELTVNKGREIFDVEPDEMLLDTLRRHGLKSVRRGCDTTSCGVCTVLVDGMPVPSCSYLSVRADGKHVTTVEGIQKEAEELSEHFGDEGADQCGFCNAGIALSVYALKNKTTSPNEEHIKDALTGHLCRCTGYVSQLKAIKAYLKEGEHE